MHRYLYANASPAVFLDPTGEVPILSDLANGFDRLSANRIDAAVRTTSLRNDNTLNNVAIATGGFGNGVISGASGILGAAFGVVNFGANVAIRNVLPDSTAIAGQVDVELDQGFRTLDTVTTTASSFVQIAVEDLVQAGAIAVSVTASLAESAGSVLHQAFIEGDPGAAAKTSAFVTEAVLTGGGIRTIARNAGKSLLNASNKAKSLATATIDKAKRAAQAVTNAAAQAAKSAQALAQRTSSQLRTIAKSFNESVNQRLFGGSTVFDKGSRGLKQEFPSASSPNSPLEVEFLSNEILDGVLRARASRRNDKGPDGFIDIIAHGNRNMIAINYGNKELRLTPSGLSDFLDTNFPELKGKNLRLLSCSTGCDGEDSFAAILAQLRGVDVIAPNKLLFFDNEGKHIVSDGVVVNGFLTSVRPPTGQFFKFQPSGKSKAVRLQDGQFSDD